MNTTLWLARDWWHMRFYYPHKEFAVLSSSFFSQRVDDESVSCCLLLEGYCNTFTVSLNPSIYLFMYIYSYYIESSWPCFVLVVK